MSPAHVIPSERSKKVIPSERSDRGIFYCGADWRGQSQDVAYFDDELRYALKQ
ncbi:MAG: hypothetical protein ACR2NM_07455 [Bythopirellula sp.]